MSVGLLQCDTTHFFLHEGRRISRNQSDSPDWLVKGQHDDVGTYVIRIIPSGPGGTGSVCTATLRVSR